MPLGARRGDSVRVSAVPSEIDRRLYNRRQPEQAEYGIQPEDRHHRDDPGQRSVGVPDRDGHRDEKTQDAWQHRHHADDDGALDELSQDEPPRPRVQKPSEHRIVFVTGRRIRPVASGLPEERRHRIGHRTRARGEGDQSPSSRAQQLPGASEHAREHPSDVTLADAMTLKEPNRFPFRCRQGVLTPSGRGRGDRLTRPDAGSARRAPRLLRSPASARGDGAHHTTLRAPRK